MVSSARGGEGRSTLATYMALLLASSGSPTLLADLNFRFPDLAHLLALSGSLGEGWEASWLAGRPEEGPANPQSARQPEVWPLYSPIPDPPPTMVEHLFDAWRDRIRGGETVIADLPPGENVFLQVLGRHPLRDSARIVFLYQPILSRARLPYWAMQFSYVLPVAFRALKEGATPIPGSLEFQDAREAVWRGIGQWEVPAVLAGSVNRILDSL